MSKTTELLASPLRVPVALILAMFFGLSGFLVTGSLLRSASLISFLGLRVLRLGPGLLVEVIFAALILGPLFTCLPIEQYFSDPKFSRYFLNIIGDIQYLLPGVFVNNPLPEVVNQQLWTIPFELRCYGAISVLAVVGIVFNRWLLAVFVTAVQLAAIYYVLVYHPDHQLMLRGNLLVLCFLYGVGFFLWREFIPYSLLLALLAAVLSAWLLLSSSGDFLVAGPAVYLTCYLGLTNPKKLSILGSGDYSYGVFIYGFPIQQAFAALLPNWNVWWVNILVCVPTSIAFAVVSWHLVEKHGQKLRPLLFEFEAAVLARIPLIRLGPVRFLGDVRT